MRKLNDLIHIESELIINEIKSDSRKVTAGDLFIAINGYNVDHYNYIDDAINNGATCVICDKEYISDKALIILVDDIMNVYEDICAKFYNKNKWKFKLIGVTGTDGKTTTSMMINDLLAEFTKSCYIGTNGFFLGDEVFPTNNTTPCKEELYNYLNKAYEYGCKFVTMEVSSESLLHKRIDGLLFDLICFTNITEDHLNIHKTLDNYIKCKLGLINYLKKDGYIIYNFDDNNLKNSLDIKNNNVYSCGKNDNSMCQITSVKKCNNYSLFDLKFNDNLKHYYCPFIGEYNIYNLSMAIISCYLFGYKDISIENIKTVPGRCEVLDFNTPYKIMIDYAHTTNGIKTILESVDNTNLIVISGCAGGREVSKRSEIGELLLNNSKLVIFTMDDPRYENVDDIIDQMIGNSTNTNYKRIVNRKDAIYYAFDNAKKDDLILILGKGRDEYMAIGDEKVYYSDYEVIKDYFDKK